MTSSSGTGGVARPGVKIAAAKRDMTLDLEDGSGEVGFLLEKIDASLDPPGEVVLGLSLCNAQSEVSNGVRCCKNPL